jgi:peptide deformylase
MALPEIVQAGDPVLRRVADLVDPKHIGTQALVDLVETMTEVMRKAPGVGLAAPQIGIPLQVIVLEDAERLMARLKPDERDDRERTPFGLVTIVNPTLEIIDEGGSPPPAFFEGCLSVQGYMAIVRRHREVRVRGVDAMGNPVDWQVKGWPARILQHEIDHLRGTLYVDKMLSRSYAANAEVSSRWFGLPIPEVLERLGVDREPDPVSRK